MYLKFKGSFPNSSVSYGDINTYLWEISGHFIYCYESKDEDNSNNPLYRNFREKYMLLARLSLTAMPVVIGLYDSKQELDNAFATYEKALKEDTHFLDLT